LSLSRIEPGLLRLGVFVGRLEEPRRGVFVVLEGVGVTRRGVLDLRSGTATGRADRTGVGIITRRFGLRRRSRREDRLRSKSSFRPIFVSRDRRERVFDRLGVLARGFCTRVGVRRGVFVSVLLRVRDGVRRRVLV
jgi:hypothetical protein